MRLMSGSPDLSALKTNVALGGCLLNSPSRASIDTGTITNPRFSQYSLVALQTSALTPALEKPTLVPDVTVKVSGPAGITPGDAHAESNNAQAMEAKFLAMSALIVEIDFLGRERLAVR
jgi:hypothetical protein